MLKAHCNRCDEIVEPLRTWVADVHDGQERIARIAVSVDGPECHLCRLCTIHLLHQYIEALTPDESTVIDAEVPA